MLHAKDSLGGSRSSCFMRETGKDSPLSSSSKWWTRTSAGITRSASRFRWAHAVPFNTGKASALKCKPVQEIRRTPSLPILTDPPKISAFRYRQRLAGSWAGSTESRHMDQFDVGDNILAKDVLGCPLVIAVLVVIFRVLFSGSYGTMRTRWLRLKVKILRLHQLAAPDPAPSTPGL